MKKSFYIIAIISILVSCTSSTSGPKTKNDYIDSATSFYNDVESQKESMNDEKWSEFKDKNDKIIGEEFLKFREGLTAKEIVRIGNNNKKFQQYYSKYKESCNHIDESLRDDGDSLEIVDKIKYYHQHNMDRELGMFLDDAIRVGGQVKNYPKAILFELEIDEEYKEKWGESW